VVSAVAFRACQVIEDALLPHDRRGIGEYQSDAPVIRFAWGLSLSIGGVEMAMITIFCRELFVF
jgi:hypothetical protein